jgi:DNA adenine methylase
MRACNLDHFPSPLRYPGGKGKVANYLKLLFLSNGMVGHQYAEPYAGGASVALSLLFEEYASHIHINDLNPSVHSFWNAVLNSTDELCKRVTEARLTMEEWHRQKGIQQVPDADPIDLAFSTFFLNRTNRSGIIEGGIIGGKDQRGRWKMDARFNKVDLVRRIRKVARHASRITLTRRDGAEYLREVVPTLSPATFVYLDPPYFVKGRGLYQNFYGPDEHAEVAREVTNLQNPWLVSYDAAPEIMELYGHHPMLTYGLAYSAADRYRGAEVMFFSRNLIRPLVDTPAKVRGKLVQATRLELMAA